MGSKPEQAPNTLIEHGKFKILIMKSPTEDTAAQFVTELKSIGVTDVVRTCEPTYSTDKFEKAGITVHEMTFPDGAAPPEDTINRWNSWSGADTSQKTPQSLALLRFTVLLAWDALQLWLLWR